MDWLEFDRVFDAMLEDRDFEIDVYDAASWMCITALSEQSIAMGSMPVPVPDFTDGEWIHRKGEVQGRYALDSYDPSASGKSPLKTN